MHKCITSNVKKALLHKYENVWSSQVDITLLVATLRISFLLATSLALSPSLPHHPCLISTKKKEMWFYKIWVLHIVNCLLPMQITVIAKDKILGREPVRRAIVALVSLAPVGVLGLLPVTSAAVWYDSQPPFDFLHPLFALNTTSSVVFNCNLATVKKS